MDKVLEIAKMIDHSLLHPTMTDKELKDQGSLGFSQTWLASGEQGCQPNKGMSLKFFH